MQAWCRTAWFYKEILTWYDEILQSLLNNFSLRKDANETMGRNFPLLVVPIKI